MICPFCKRDVAAPCRSTQEMQQRAADNVDRCAQALKSHQGLAGSGAR